jgi:hypothetical protein
VWDEKGITNSVRANTIVKVRINVVSDPAQSPAAGLVRKNPSVKCGVRFRRVSLSIEGGLAFRLFLEVARASARLNKTAQQIAVVEIRMNVTYVRVGNYFTYRD